MRKATGYDIAVGTGFVCLQTTLLMHLFYGSGRGIWLMLSGTIGVVMVLIAMAGILQRKGGKVRVVEQGFWETMKKKRDKFFGKGYSEEDSNVELLRFTDSVREMIMKEEDYEIQLEGKIDYLLQVQWVLWVMDNGSKEWETTVKDNIEIVRKVNKLYKRYGQGEEYLDVRIRKVMIETLLLLTDDGKELYQTDMQELDWVEKEITAARLRGSRK